MSIALAFSRFKRIHPVEVCEINDRAGVITPCDGHTSRLGVDARLDTHDTLEYDFCKVHARSSTLGRREDYVHSFEQSTFQKNPSRRIAKRTVREGVIIPSACHTSRLVGVQRTLAT